MQLGRYQLDPSTHLSLSSVSFSHDGSFFSVTDERGYSIWRTFPLQQLRRRDLKGSLERVIMLEDTPLLALQGGGRNPLYPPNKVVIYHDEMEVSLADLEFDEPVRNVTARPGSFVVVLSHSVIWYDYGVSKRRAEKAAQSAESEEIGDDEGVFWIERRATWTTTENQKGLVALRPTENRTIVAIPGRQPGHVQLLHLTTSSAISPGLHITGVSQTQSRRTPIIIAHTHSISALAISPDGRYLVTASSRGTLLRMWDIKQGHMVRELRRGADRASIWGLVFSEMQEDGGKIACWSDKGTVHVWTYDEATGQKKQTTENTSPRKGLLGSRKAVASLVKANVPLPKYFHAEASHMQYSLPPLRHQDSRHGSGSSRASQLLGERFWLTWVGNELALVTQHGDWYRLSLEQSDLDEVSRTATCKVVEHRKLWRLDGQD